jgi:aryl-alcohol dehydrogenase-like predicted oxidoreductase
MHENSSHTSRRKFLKSTLTIPVALAAAPAVVAQSVSGVDTPAAAADKPAVPPAGPLPTRPLGKSGPRVTMVNMGGMPPALSPQYLDIAWANGIRCFDTAASYIKGRSEKVFAEWLAKYPERRKDMFLVTKDHPRSGAQMLETIDRRLAACGTDYLDAFYIHGIGRRGYGEDSVNWFKNDEFLKASETLKSSGKVKMLGFSCHDGDLNDYLNAAAGGGWVEVIMLKYTPFFTKGDAFDTALEACHKAGIGLIAMKTLRTAGKDIPSRVPEFDKLGLTTHQAMLHAVWSDPRIASVCCQLENVGQMEENAAAARSYKTPLKTAQIHLLRQTVLASRRTFCPGCPSCDAFAVSSAFALLEVARYVTYYEQEGSLEARGYYRELPASARDATGVDLAALRDRCAFHVDYPEVVKRAGRYFA